MKKTIVRIFSTVIIILFLAPILFTLSHSFMDSFQINSDKVSFLPEIFNIQQYYKISVDVNEYFRLYINSVAIVFIIIIGQLIVSITAAYYFARRKSKLSEIIFLIYIFLMLLPLQITLIPNVFLYSSIEKYIGFKLFDTHLAIILPGIFSTIGVFFLKQFFESIPNHLYEMARIDGANKFQILTKVVIPYSKNAIFALCILNFVENWNIIEQALIFLNSMSKMPVSIYLNTIYSYKKEIYYAGSMLFMFPIIYLAIKAKTKVSSIAIKENIRED